MRRKVNNLHDLITVTPQGDGNSFFHCKSSFWHPPVRFNYRYPARGRKRFGEEITIIGRVVQDLITVTPQGDGNLQISITGPAFTVFDLITVTP